MIEPITAGIGLGLQVLSNRNARKKAQAAANAEASRIAIEADAASKSLLLEAQANNDQRELVQDRLLLADRAEMQAEKEAEGAVGPDVTLALAEDPLKKTRRRNSFFKQPASGEQI